MAGASGGAGNTASSGALLMLCPFIALKLLAARGSFESALAGSFIVYVRSMGHY